MSESISCSARAAEFLARIRRGEKPGTMETRALGDECPSEFFRIVVEALADSFDPGDAAIYEELMRAWIPPTAQSAPEIPGRVERVYVLSRVTLGADIKLVSPMLHAMRMRFPDARLIFAGNRKSAELFAAAHEIEFLEADYPRKGSIGERIAFAQCLAERLRGPDRIVLDPDSRITQLGLIAVCEPERYFHFPSRTLGGGSSANLSDLVSQWLRRSFGLSGRAWVAPKRVEPGCERPVAAVSLGVGENETKRLGIEFETKLIALLAERFQTVYLDRGAGGAEASRVTEAAVRSGAAARVRFHEGSFAGFVSVISQSDFYAGYDSAGQHAAAAARIPLVTFFAGAPSERFRQRWEPVSAGAHVIDADTHTPEECLQLLSTVLPGHS